MAKMTTEEILGIFEEMSVLELKEFLDAFEEKFDVTGVMCEVSQVGSRF